VSLAELWRVVLRRRWVLVPGLVVALLAAGIGFLSTPPTYSRSQSYLLLSPVVTEQGRGNPFLQLGNGVGMAASVLSKRVSGGETAAAITASEPRLEYTVSLDPTTSAPVLLVTVEGPSLAVVGAALERLGTELTDQLAALQRDAGAPEVSWVTIGLLTGDAGSQVSYAAGMRAGVVAGAAALLLLLVLVTGLETHRLRGARKDSAASRPVDEEARGPLPSATTAAPSSADGGRSSSLPPQVSAAGTGAGGGR
jgi:hypothetical protein